MSHSAFIHVQPVVHSQLVIRKGGSLVMTLVVILEILGILFVRRGSRAIESYLNGSPAKMIRGRWISQSQQRKADRILIGFVPIGAVFIFTGVYLIIK